jgi:putative photosynthetic complex assembly protein
MSQASAKPGFPRLPLVGALTLVTLSLLAAAAGRLTGAGEREPTGVATLAREFRVADGADGSVLVFDAHSGRQIEAVTGQNGFLRGTLRALARERRMESIGPAAAFRLTAWNDGRMTLDDLATGGRVELEAFGPDNVAVFARLLTAPGGRS